MPNIILLFVVYGKPDNDKTYFNDHQAKLEGVVSWIIGECK